MHLLKFLHMVDLDSKCTRNALKMHSLISNSTNFQSLQILEMIGSRITKRFTSKISTIDIVWNLYRLLDRLPSISYHHPHTRTELITHGYCIENYRKTNPNCNHEFEYNYPLIFLKIARFQVGGHICVPLIKFRKCMIDPLMRQCDQRAMTIWNDTLNTVVRGFCYRQQYINGDRSLHSNHHLFIILLFALLTFHSRFSRVV